MSRQWSRVHGAVYCIHGFRPGPNGTLSSPPTVAYVGKWASEDWPERIRQHLYGGGQYGKPAQLWANTVPGYDSRARTLKEQQAVVRRLIAAGIVYRVWYGRCFYWYLDRRELKAIWRLLPLYNIIGNLDNDRRVPPWEIEAQAVDRQRRVTRSRLNRS